MTNLEHRRQIILTFAPNINSEMALSKEDIDYYLGKATQTAAEIIEKAFGGIIIVRAEQLSDSKPDCPNIDLTK